MNISELSKKIGYVFNDETLTITALTHSSYANESKVPGTQSYERLEFLGDSILGFITAELLYKNSHHKEGELTRMRATLVCEQSLAKAADKLDIGEHILLGKGELAGSGYHRPSLLADVMEALIAAIFLDGGIEAARGFIRRFILTDETVSQAEHVGDYKTELQELMQRDKKNTLMYRLAGEKGPDHAKRFVIEAVINGKVVGSGEGSSKKEAEQNSAKNALTVLKAEK